MASGTIECDAITLRADSTIADAGSAGAVEREKILDLTSVFPRCEEVPHTAQITKPFLAERPIPFPIPKNAGFAASEALLASPLITPDPDEAPPGGHSQARPTAAPISVRQRTVTQASQGRGTLPGGLTSCGSRQRPVERLLRRLHHVGDRAMRQRAGSRVQQFVPAVEIGRRVTR